MKRLSTLIILISFILLSLQTAQTETFGPGERPTYWSYDRVAKTWNHKKIELTHLINYSKRTSEKINSSDGFELCNEDLERDIREIDKRYMVNLFWMEDRIKESNFWKNHLDEFQNLIDQVEENVNSYKDTLQKYFGRRDFIALVDACIKWRVSSEGAEGQPKRFLPPDKTEVHPPEIRQMER